MVDTPSKERYVTWPGAVGPAKRVRYQALRQVFSRPQVWGTVTAEKARSSKAAVSAPPRSSLPRNRHGPARATRVRVPGADDAVRAAGSGFAAGGPSVPPQAQRAAARASAAPRTGAARGAMA